MLLRRCCAGDDLFRQTSLKDQKSTERLCSIIDYPSSGCSPTKFRGGKNMSTTLFEGESIYLAVLAPT